MLYQQLVLAVVAIAGAFGASCDLIVDSKGWTKCSNIFEPKTKILHEVGHNDYEGEMWLNVAGPIQAKFQNRGLCNFFGLHELRFPLEGQIDLSMTDPDYCESGNEVGQKDHTIRYRCKDRKRNLKIHVEGPDHASPVRLEFNSPWYSGNWGSVLYDVRSNRGQKGPKPSWKVMSDNAFCRVKPTGGDFGETEPPMDVASVS
eukprot:Clim_evm1s79 gene=Clim_evmTU1s79